MKDKKVQVKFNKLFKNKNITLKMIDEAKSIIAAELKEIHGKRVVAPNESTLISAKIFEMTNEPIIFLRNMIYSLSEEDALHYTSLSENLVTDEYGPQYFSDSRKLEMFKKPYFVAELV